MSIEELARDYRKLSDELSMLIRERDEIDRWTCMVAITLAIPISPPEDMGIREQYRDLRAAILRKVNTLRSNGERNETPCNVS